MYSYEDRIKAVMALTMSVLQMGLPSNLLKDDIKNLMIISLLKEHNFQMQDDDAKQLFNDILYNKYGDKVGYILTTKNTFMTGIILGIILGVVFIYLY